MKHVIVAGSIPLPPIFVKIQFGCEINTAFKVGFKALTKFQNAHVGDTNLPPFFATSWSKSMLCGHSRC